MNVTFLIGNGFDLNLGLDTRYTDFIEEYIEEKPLDTEIIKNFKKDLKEDKEKANLWSNAELAMGQYSIKVAERYKQRAAEIYCDLHDDFCEKLAQYLQDEQQRIEIPDLKEKFIKSFSNILKGFSTEQTNQLNYLIRKGQADYYNFIIYNYTTIIDDLIVDNRKIGAHTHIFPNGSSATYSDTIIDLIHVHGTTTEAMVLGVNDITQIGAPQIFDGQPDELKNTFLKKEFNAMVEEGTFEKTQTILGKSNLIYIYGMSLGETDKIWWQQIYQLLQKNSSLRVIIHSIDTPTNLLTPRNRIAFAKKQKNQLIKYSLEENREIDNELLSRIHITGFNIFQELKDAALVKLKFTKEAV